MSNLKMSSPRKSRLRNLLAFAVLGSLGAVAVPVSAQDASTMFDGEWRYRTSCAGCHGADGSGHYGFGPPLKGNRFVQNVPAPAIIQLIQNGRLYDQRNYPAYPGMPAFHYIRAGEAEALVGYLKGDLQN